MNPNSKRARIVLAPPGAARPYWQARHTLSVLGDAADLPDLAGEHDAAAVLVANGEDQAAAVWGLLNLLHRLGLVVELASTDPPQPAPVPEANGHAKPTSVRAVLISGNGHAHGATDGAAAAPARTRATSTPRRKGGGR